MPLFLKSIDPTLNIFGIDQTLRFNSDQLNNEANLILQNLFTPLVGANLNTGLAFVNSSLNGFRFKHEFTLSSAQFGNFYLECASRFGGNSSNIFKYDELTDSLSFFKNVSIPGLKVNSNLNIQLNQLMMTNSNLIFNWSNNNQFQEYSCYHTLQDTNPPSHFTHLVQSGSGNTHRRWLTVYKPGFGSQPAGSYEINFYHALNGFQYPFKIDTYGSTLRTYFGTIVNMQNNNIINLPNGSNPNDAVNKSQLDAKTVTSSQVTGFNDGVMNIISARSILYGYNAATYSTNVAVNDHIKFDSSVFVRGSNISLDTSTAYNTSTNTASLGRITLTAGKTYKLTGSINNAISSGNGDYNAIRWYNSDNGAALGLISGAAPPNSTINRVPSAGTIAYITTSVSTRVELRITWNVLSRVNGAGDSVGPAWFTAEEV